ncbi:hypothetical protein Clacol_009035 [Clathrus columnatus]|uniref:Uncharacterized protein n=1 Tax=Clathrus columnatus TaxID=1419009 RepID=A0AAV5ALX4_9AGAM|nr:hypothetical protein Clacol_009035 [Clathrus columnatus]
MPTTRAQSGAKVGVTAKKRQQQKDDTKTGTRSQPRTETTERESPSKRVKIDDKVDIKQGDGKEEQEETKLSDGPGKEEKENMDKKDVKPKKEEETEVKGEDSKTAEDGSSESAEFQPQKVGIEESEDIDDVAKLSLLLVPRPPKPEEDEKGFPTGTISHEDGVPIKYFRYIVMGKKHLPYSETKHEVFWGAITDIGDNLSKLEGGLEEQVYQTKTKGERHKGPVRLAGRGVYLLCTPVDPKLPPSRGQRTFLAYNLTHPSVPGEVQEELGIEASSSFLIQVKNPDQPNPPKVGLRDDKKADYPKEGKEETFGAGAEARRFKPANPPTLLDYQGVEILLIGDKKNLDTILQEGSAQVMEQEATQESQTLTTEEVMKEVMLDTDKFSTEALQGHWI